MPLGFGCVPNYRHVCMCGPGRAGVCVWSGECSMCLTSRSDATEILIFLSPHLHVLLSSLLWWMTHKPVGLFLLSVLTVKDLLTSVSAIWTEEPGFTTNSIIKNVSNITKIISQMSKYTFKYDLPSARFNALSCTEAVKASLQGMRNTVTGSGFQVEFLSKTYAPKLYWLCVTV